MRVKTKNPSFERVSDEEYHKITSDLTKIFGENCYRESAYGCQHSSGISGYTISDQRKNNLPSGTSGDCKDRGNRRAATRDLYNRISDLAKNRSTKFYKTDGTDVTTIAQTIFKTELTR